MLSLEAHKKLGVELNDALRTAKDRWPVIFKAYGKGSNQARIALHAMDEIDRLRYPLEKALMAEHGQNFDRHIYFPERA
ncbi:hypothetical protein LCGC14_0542260 [marine sediment metagenome]|uniref:Uncharacterized protein n=1 Tax=marine sediment metagenome TaxID=412755 RepID=A0A0F9UDS3_9ZZZZ